MKLEEAKVVLDLKKSIIGKTYKGIKIKEILIAPSDSELLQFYKEKHESEFFVDLTAPIFFNVDFELYVVFNEDNNNGWIINWLEVDIVEEYFNRKNAK